MTKIKQVTGARCTLCGRVVEAGPETTVCPKCGGILDIEYDYDYIRRKLSKYELMDREDFTMWRYMEFLPVEGIGHTPRLRVGGSPLYKAERLAGEIGLTGTLYIKDDGQNPTASLKDRASAMAVVKAEEAGKSVIACSSTGNAASSLAGNAAAAGMSTYIFVPARAPKGKVAQLMMFGAKVILVDGSYEDTFRLSAEAIEHFGWYNRNAAINPFLMEGKKTVSLEIAEQLQFRMPDYVAVSVGDGCTIAGVWKGFKDLYAAGFIKRLPRASRISMRPASLKGFRGSSPYRHPAAVRSTPPQRPTRSTGRLRKKIRWPIPSRSAYRGTRSRRSVRLRNQAVSPSTSPTMRSSRLCASSEGLRVYLPNRPARQELQGLKKPSLKASSKRTRPSSHL